MLFTSLLLAIGALKLLTATAKAIVGEVPRDRVEQFARLHSLPITAGNGNQVIVYRATTRRWRTSGLTAGIAIQVAITGIHFLDAGWAFVGWFLGAAVAELRVAHLDHGPRASASLKPRRLADYLPLAGRFAVPGTMVLCVLTAGYCVAEHHAHPAGDLKSVAMWTALGLGVGLVALTAQRHVLRRPQPMAEPDRLAADDAIRSRSMHVLAAAGMVLAGACIGNQLDAADILHHDRVADVFNTVVGFGLPITGWFLAYRRSPTRRKGSTPAPPPSAPSAPEPA